MSRYSDADDDMSDPAHRVVREGEVALDQMDGVKPWYSVTSDGRVLSRSGWRRHGQRELIPARDGGGYLKVRLTRLDGTGWNVKVHRLVAAAFLSARPPGAQIRHLDGDRKNNSASNLRWGTGKQNADDRERHGTTARGVRHGRAKLAPEAVRQIRDRLAGEESQRSIANRFGVTQKTVFLVSKGRTWKEVAG